MFLKRIIFSRFGYHDESYQKPVLNEIVEELKVFLSRMDLDSSANSNESPTVNFQTYHTPDFDFDEQLMENFCKFSRSGKSYKDLSSKYTIQARMKQIQFLETVLMALEDVNK